MSKPVLAPTRGWYQQDTYLVEQPDGERDYEEGENVGGGGDDGCNNEYDHDGMAAVAAHQPSAD